MPRISISSRQAIIALSALVGVLVTMIIALLFIMLADYSPALSSKTPPPALTIQPSVTTLPSLTLLEMTSTPELTTTPLPVCQWLPFSDAVQVPQTYPPDCFAGLLDVGLGEKDGRLLFYKTVQNRRGLYGLIKYLGTADDISLTVDVKKLIAGRFVVTLGPSLVPNDSSVGLRIQSDDGKAFFVKVVYYLPGGYEKVLSSSPSDSNWGQIYNVNFKVVGSKVKVIVNKATLVQWEINFDKRFLFVGYQALPVEKASTSLDVSVEFP